MREQKSLKVPAKTVTVLLSSEVVWQRVPDRRTHNSEGPTAECGEPVSVSVSRYDYLETSGLMPLLQSAYRRPVTTPLRPPC